MQTLNLGNVETVQIPIITVPKLKHEETMYVSVEYNECPKFG
jgi:hypothetical protein